MDLRTGSAFWLLRNGLMQAYPPLLPSQGQTQQVEVLVLGAGITGALVADRLCQDGREVMVLDRRDVAFGSTSASTALLQYEIDTELLELADLIGREDANRAYQLCAEAIGEIRNLVQTLPDDCGYSDRGSLYLASRRSHVRRLRKEAAARAEAGLEAEFLSAAAVEDRFGIDAPGGIWSPLGAQVDPYRLAHHLLHRAEERGAKIFDRTEVTELSSRKDGSWQARTGSGVTIHAQWVVLATGYEAERFLPKPLAKLRNSYALVTEPIGQEPWPTGCLIWESARPYLYARTTVDGRVIIGGEDDAFASPKKREASLASKQRKLEAKLENLFGNLNLQVAFSWAGTFGETKDGLAHIGPQTPGSRLLLALGYGGNGITYSTLAAGMLTRHIRGETVPDLRLFRPER